MLPQQARIFLVDAHRPLKHAALAVGKAVLRGLEARGVDPAGSEKCGEQCSGCVDGWRYTPRKNKQKLRATRARHKKLRELSLAGYATSFGPGKPLEAGVAASLEK